MMEIKATMQQFHDWLRSDLHRQGLIHPWGLRLTWTNERRAQMVDAAMHVWATVTDVGNTTLRVETDDAALIERIRDAWGLDRGWRSGVADGPTG